MVFIYRSKHRVHLFPATLRADNVTWAQQRTQKTKQLCLYFVNTIVAPLLIHSSTAPAPRLHSSTAPLLIHSSTSTSPPWYASTRCSSPAVLPSPQRAPSSCPPRQPRACDAPPLHWTAASNENQTRTGTLTEKSRYLCTKLSVRDKHIIPLVLQRIDLRMRLALRHGQLIRIVGGRAEILQLIFGVRQPRRKTGQIVLEFDNLRWSSEIL